MHPIRRQLHRLVRTEPGPRPHAREHLLARDHSPEIRAFVMIASFPLFVLAAWNTSPGTAHVTLLLATALVVACNVIGTLPAWRRSPRWADTLPVLGSLVGIAVMAACGGGFSTSLAAAAYLPVIWLAIYADPPDIAAGLVILAAGALGPLDAVFDGIPDQGPLTYRAAALMFGVVLTIVVRPLVVELREQVRSCQRATRTLRASQAALAHDLRTPLTSMCALATMASERVASGELDDLRAAGDYTDRIADLGWQAETTIKGVLELSRAGESLPSIGDVDLGRLATELAAHIDSLELTLGDLPRTIVGHEPSLRRAFHNLLHNASQHARTVDGGPVRVHVSCDAVANGWRIQVADDGPGIDPAEARSLLEPWHRGRTARSTGHGLGLAIVAAIAEQHGGGIDVDNAPDGGARFTMLVARTPRIDGDDR